MYCYAKENGIAENIRFVPDDYVPKTDELSGQAEPLPTREELSDPDAWAAFTAPVDAAPTAVEKLTALLVDAKVISVEQAADLAQTSVRPSLTPRSL